MKWTRPLGSAQIGPRISSGKTHLPNVTVISRPLVRAYECVQQVQRLSFKGIQCAHMRPNVRHAKVQRMLILVNEIYMRFDYTCARVTFEDPLTRGVWPFTIVINQEIPLNDIKVLSCVFFFFLNKRTFSEKLTKTFCLIITGQSGQCASRTFSVTLHIYFIQFKPRESCW